MSDDKKEKLLKEIVIDKNTTMTFPIGNSGDVLIFGNFNNVCGEVSMNNGVRRFSDDICEDVFANNLLFIVSTLISGDRIFIAASSKTIEYFKNLIYCVMDTYFSEWDEKKVVKFLNYHVYPIDTTEIYEATYRKYNEDSAFRKAQASKKITEVLEDAVFGRIGHMKFNTIITNPPYAGSLHLEIFERLLDRLDEKGQMTIIEPATWLINVRKNGKAKKYDAIKKRIEGHVKSVKIENLNKDFNTGLYVPFSITTIDFTNTYNTIEFECCGEKKIVDSIYDCNLIGDYKTIWSILNKVLAYGDMMDKHTTNKDKGTGMWYAKYDDITPFGIDPAEGVANLGRGGASKNDNNYVNLAMGEYGYNYVQTSFHRIVGITQSVPKKLKPGSNYTNPKYSDTNADCVYGTKQELENWKHFIFNNKLPLFINIVLTIDQHNNSKEFLPWLVDKQYTDEEIYAKFNLTQDEIDLIDATLKKFERNSPWFKRYMLGPDENDKTKQIESDVEALVNGV